MLGGLRVGMHMGFSREGRNASVCFGQGGLKSLDSVTAGICSEGELAVDLTKNPRLVYRKGI